jgi:deoxycytidylate deaminase
MEHAKKMALQSDFPDYRHGAVLIKGNSIRNSTYNKDNFCSFGQRFQKDHTGRTTVHAELGVILGLDRSITSGATVYVARVGKIDEEYRMSKPCQMCNAAMKYVGIKRVVYTINDKEVGSYRL